MKNIILFLVLISLFGCYTLHRDQNGPYIYYKGSKTVILKDEKNNMYFINEKGKKVKLESPKPIGIKKAFKK